VNLTVILCLLLYACELITHFSMYVRKKAIIILSDCDIDFVEDKLKIGFKDSVHVNKVLMPTTPLILYAA
jgi:hypothetical protein